MNPRVNDVASITFVAGVVLLASAKVVDPFIDVTPSSGIDVILKNGATPEKHQIETMAGGVAVLDFDGDGRLDIFFTNGARQPQLLKPDATWHNKLYRNLGDWRFEDATDKAGLRGEGYSFGAAVADYDNDGHTDLFVAALPRSILYRNRGDRTFEDVTQTTGVTGGAWPIAAGWFDYNRDGRLDLFVVNYVRWDPKTEPFCGDAKRTYRTYCHPKYYEPVANSLYRNDGDGAFTDVSAATRIAQHRGKGMGLAFADYDGDGDMDVFVANDTFQNFLFRNEGGERFTQVGLQAGIAFNDDGRALSSMGVDFRDVDNDGREDLFVSALANETFPLYRNAGKGLFVDVTYPSRIGAATMPLSGWSNGIFDFDNDGWKDLFVANGDVQDNTELFSSRKSKQQNLLLLNKRDGTFSPQAFGDAAWHRGAAFADLDNDGGIDAIVTRLNETPELLRNTLGGNHWIGLRLPIGARVRISTAAGDRWNHASTSVGYASSSDPRVHFGLGAETVVKAIEITWPSGSVQRLENVKADQYIAVTEPGNAP